MRNETDIEIMCQSGAVKIRRRMVSAGSKVLAMGVTVIAEPAHFFEDRSICSADVLFLTVFEMGTLCGNGAEGVLLLQPFSNHDTVIHGYMFLVTSYLFTHKYLFFTADRRH